MVLAEYLGELRQRGVIITEAKFRHAVKNDRLPRPRLNAAHQFDFTAADVDAAAAYFADRREVSPCN